MLEVEKILPSPLTPLVLPHPIPEPVCEMQTPALFTMAQSSPQSVDTANYARLNPLPSPANSSSSSGEIHLYSQKDTSSPLVPVGPPSSSQEVLFQEDNQVPQPPLIFETTTQTAIPISQPPPQPTSIHSWADEVATAEQSGRSTAEIVVPNWAYSGRICGSRPRSQPLVYPPPLMPASVTLRPHVPFPRYGPTISPLRPEPFFPQPPPTIDQRRRIIIRALTFHPEDFHKPQHMKSILCAHLRSRLRNRLLDTQQAPHEAHISHHLVIEEILLLPHKGSFTDLLDPIFVFISSQIFSALTQSKVSVSPSGSTTRPHRHNTVLSPRPVPALLDNWKTSMSNKVGIETSH